MGLPERFANGTERDIISIGRSHESVTASSPGGARSTDGGRGSFLLLVPDPAAVPIGTPEEIRSLGHQYVLGIIPLTYLYFQHGADTFVLELLLETARDMGLSVTVGARSEADRIRKHHPGAPVIELLPISASVTAYDVVFFRIVSMGIEGGIVLPGGGGAIPLAAQTTEYLASAHAPRLALMFERLARSLLIEQLRRLPLSSRRSHGADPPPSDIPRLLRIADPSFKKGAFDEQGGMIAAGYGFASVTPFGAGAVRRLVQRGFHAGATAGSLLPVSVRQGEESLRASECPEGSVLLGSEIERLTLDDERLGLEILLRAERCRTGLYVPLTRARCEVSLPLNTRVDGAAAVTVETAARLLAERFLRGRESGTDEATRCESVADQE